MTSTKMPTITDDIIKLQKEINEKNTELDKLNALSDTNPGLKRYEGRWKKIVYYSSDVNPKADRFDMRRNCGCCFDSPLEIWPYLETSEGKIYTDPPKFVVGEKSYYGDRPRAGWQKLLKDAHIDESIIGSIQVHFDKCKQEAMESVESGFSEIKEEEESDY